MIILKLINSFNFFLIFYFYLFSNQELKLLIQIFLFYLQYFILDHFVGVKKKNLYNDLRLNTTLAFFILGLFHQQTNCSPIQIYFLFNLENQFNIGKKTLLDQLELIPALKIALKLNFFLFHLRLIKNFVISYSFEIRLSVIVTY